MTTASQRGYVELPESVFRSGLTPRAIAVLGNLCSHEGDDDDVTVRTIAHELEMSPNTVVSALDDLEAEGVVERVKPEYRGGRFLGNSYKIDFSVLTSPKGGDK